MRTIILLVFIAIALFAICIFGELAYGYMYEGHGLHPIAALLAIVAVLAALSMSLSCFNEAYEERKLRDKNSD